MVKQDSASVLRAGDLTLELAPQVGGSIAAFYSQGEGGRVDWLRPASAEALLACDPLGMASFPLVPWCNRIRDGRARAHGREIRLQPNYDSPHTIHGIGWQTPWHVIGSGQAEATLQMRLEDESLGWPWAFTATQRYTLTPAGFACELSVRNDSSGTMPCGLGHHPYFPHHPGTVLQCEVASMWEGDAQLLPTRLVEPAFLDELRTGMELSRLDLDNNFTGFGHSFKVSWPSSGDALRLTASAPLDFFVLYCPQDKEFFCAEPVSNCTDWINLQHLSATAVGGAAIEPGQTQSVTFGMTPERQRSG
ncbi:MAG: aldose 1-epimerase [Pseudomonadota bacterium]